MIKFGIRQSFDRIEQIEDWRKKTKAKENLRKSDKKLARR